MRKEQCISVLLIRNFVRILPLFISGTMAGQFDGPALYTGDGADRISISWIGSDGGDGVQARVHPYAQTSSFIHIDGTGSVDRNEAYTADGGNVMSSFDLAASPNGGVTGSVLFYEDGPTDSAYAEVRITRVGADGTVTWSSTARTNFWTVPTMSDGRALAIGPSEEAFVVGGATLRDLVFKFDATGSHVWTRWVHPQAFLRATHVISDGEGGCFVGCFFAGTNEPFELIHLNANGDLVSSNTYTYGSTTAYLEVYDMALASNGDVIVAGSNNVLGAANYYFLLRVAPDGQVLWYNFYTMDQVVPTHWTGGGVLVADNGDIWFNDEYALFRTNSEGQGIQGWKVAVDMIGGYRTNWAITADRPVQSSDTIVLGGTRTVTDTLLGTFTVTLFIAPVPDESGSCFLVPVELNTVPALSALSRQVANSTSEARYTTWSSGDATRAELPVLEREEMCSTIGIFESERNSGGTLSIIPSAVVQGGSIRVVSSEPASMEIRGVSGTLIKTVPMRPGSMECELSTTGFAAGVYVVRSFGGDGVPLATARFLVQ